LKGSAGSQPAADYIVRIELIGEYASKSEFSEYI
jgi:hypothetical protein